MKITGYGTIRPGSGSKKTSGASATSSGSFADLLALSGSSENAGVSPVTDVAASALSNLLALQEISEEDIRRKKLVQQGHNMLEVLEKLRQRLLTGGISPALMQEMSRQLSVEKQATQDPVINQLIEEIELRLAVELAKLETARSLQTPASTGDSDDNLD